VVDHGAGGFSRGHSQTGSRIRPAAETLALLEPLRKTWGITRLANITGLDRIGIPVWLAIRPNSRSLTVASGKGVTHDAARCSALCESIESHYGERFEGPVRLARFTDFERPAVVDPEKLAKGRGSTYAATATLPWVEARDVRDGSPVWVPYELVHTDATLPRRPGSGAFLFSSNGLASGNSEPEAMLHALCELVERDALALWRQRNDRARRSTRVDLNSITGAVNRTLHARLTDAGIDVVLWNVTSDIGIAAFCAVLIDRASASDLTPYPASFGVGCHPDRDIALARALTEAAQSRATSIAGTRDDMARHSYESTQAREQIDEFRQLTREPSRARFDEVVTAEDTSVTSHLRRIVERLGRRRLKQVLTVRVSPADAPLAVVRVIVPGLEGPSSSASYQPGARARRAARR
jgi:ribosomal protein S12 methylthiotransferase accessory factor